MRELQGWVSDGGLDGGGWVVRMRGLGWFGGFGPGGFERLMGEVSLARSLAWDFGDWM